MNEFPDYLTVAERNLAKVVASPLGQTVHQKTAPRSWRAQHSRQFFPPPILPLLTEHKPACVNWRIRRKKRNLLPLHFWSLLFLPSTRDDLKCI